MSAGEIDSAKAHSDDAAGSEAAPHVTETQQRILSALQSFRSELVTSGIDVRQVIATRDLAGRRIDRLDRFQIDRLIGEGGCGSVYRAYDPQLERWIALKVPLPHLAAKADFRRRFLFEAKAMARLAHPHIVPVYDVGGTDQIDSPCYIASELCIGGSLAAYLAEHDSREQRLAAVKILADLADALHHVHQSAVVHRDVKPSNVLLFPKPQADDSDPFPFVAKLTDFGLAKSTTTAAQDATTMGVAGTLKYMAPEQIEGRRDSIGPATDVYALGVLLYELLAGKVPFDSENTFELGNQIVSDDPPGMPAETPAGLAAICERCLQKLPANRYATAAELAADLRRCFAGHVPSAATKQRGRASRRTLWFVGSGLAVAAIVAIVLMVTRQQRDAAAVTKATPTSPSVSAANSPGSRVPASQANVTEAPVGQVLNEYLNSEGDEQLLAQVVGLMQSAAVQRFVHPQTGNVHHFQLVSLQRPISWQRASELAAQMKYDGRSGRLATVADLATADFIRVAFLMNRHAARRQSVWIGLSRESSEGAWRWSSDQPIGDYEDWFPGQPAGESSVAAAYRFDDGQGIPHWRWTAQANDDPLAFHFLVQF